MTTVKTFLKNKTSSKRKKPSRKLPLSFYRRSTKEVARELVGKVLCRRLRGRVLRAKITETEAYLGLTDPACHSFGAKRTPRTEIMFAPGGQAYVYFIYGVYYCFNIVTQQRDVPEAVLIRALEPLNELDFYTDQMALCGPGKLCKQLEITRELNGSDLTGNEIWVEESHSDEAPLVISGPRIGLNKKLKSYSWPLRYGLKNSQYLSRKF